MIGGKARTGFTLIELLIVAAIFSLSSLLATTVFSNIQTRQRTVQGQQRVVTDGRYVLETIARSIRTGSVNYELWGNSVVTATPTQISVIDQDNVMTCYRINGTALDVLSPATTNGTNVCTAVGAATWTSIIPTDLVVDAFRIYITPGSDPFRSTPRILSDCAAPTGYDVVGSPTNGLAGFDSTSGACVCRPGTPTDCFSGMTCNGGTATKKICLNPNVQPQVTLYLSTHSSAGGSTISTQTTLQTTVISRVYQR